MEAGNNNHQPHEFELSKGPNFEDFLPLKKPDENVCNLEKSPEQFSRYEQLVFNFFEQHQKVPQPRTVNEEACAERRPQSGISHYEQLELSFRRPLHEKEDIFLIELIDKVKNGRPSQRAEARHRLRQILEQYPNHFLRKEIKEVLEIGNRPDIHLLTRAKYDPDEEGEIIETILSKMQDFVKLLKDGNEAIWTTAYALCFKMPVSYIISFANQMKKEETKNSIKENLETANNLLISGVNRMFIVLDKLLSPFFWVGQTMLRLIAFNTRLGRSSVANGDFV